MKMMGRKHRPFFRICAIDSRNPRDGRVLEELGTYDPLVADTDARALLNAERITYWLGVGAQPSDKVQHADQEVRRRRHARRRSSSTARERLALPQGRARRRRAGVRAVRAERAAAAGRRSAASRGRSAPASEAAERSRERQRID